MTCRFSFVHAPEQSKALLTAPERGQKKSGKSYQLSVIVPTYNNGEHLRYKCFQSLSRSSIFEDMEIIIVDDGSTDDYTRV